MYSIISSNSEAGKELANKMQSRSKLEQPEIMQTVQQIVNDVRLNGDRAVFEYTRKFDNVTLDGQNVKVSEEEIEAAYSEISPELLAVMRHAVLRITDFHSRQKQNSWMETNRSGEILGQILRPLERAGVYVPGGKASYPSSVLMNIIPAKIAGVSKIVMTTPVRDGKVSSSAIVAAVEAGVDEIYKIGGAQAVAALAFGTESIPRVDKIVGPGNIYVALAKRAVFGFTGIDSIAGPSEILIIADESANPKFIAADLLSQAEHDEMASSILVTTCQSLAEKVFDEVKKQTADLPRKEIINKSLNDYGAIIVCETLNEAIEISNSIAPEHLELCVKNPFEILSEIKNAGAIFVGNYTPEPLGDYMAGPNHVLPTGGTSRFFSPLSVDDFIKKSSLLYFNEKAMYNIGNDVIAFARAEGFDAHANAVKVRMS